MNTSLGLIKWDSIVNLGMRIYDASQKMYEFSRSIAESLNNIERQAKIIGISTTAIQQWQYTAKMSDVSNEDLSIGFKRLTMSMSEAAQKSGDGYKAFEAMKIKVTDTSGALKPLDVIMMEIASKFSQWQDGPEKIALALTLFGKSGETLIPLLNQGADGIKKYFGELEKLKGLIDPKLIEAGSKAEDAFKRISTQMEAGKLRMAPFVLGFSTLIEGILKKLDDLKSWVEKNPSIWGYIIGGLIPAPINIATGVLIAKGTIPGKSELDKVQNDYLALEEYYKRTGRTKAPVLPGKAEYPEWRQIVGEEKTQYEKDYWETQQKTWKIEDNLIKIEGERAQILADDMFPSMEKVKEIQDKMTEGAEKLRIQLVEMRGLVEDFGWEDYATGLDAANVGTRELTQMTIENTKIAEQMQEQNKAFQNIGSDIANIWSSSFSQMRRSGESFSDWFKKLWLDMADYAIGQITKIAINYALFGNTKGTYNSGSGLFGLLGSLFNIGGGSALTGTSSPGLSFLLASEGGYFPGGFTPIKAFQGGGYVNRPTLGMVGEGGEGEYIIPESKMRRGDTYIINNYNQVTDPNTFVRIYGSAVKKLSEQSVAEAKRFNKIGNRS
jgi:hypothetical protein